MKFEFFKSNFIVNLELEIRAHLKIGPKRNILCCRNN